VQQFLLGQAGHCNARKQSVDSCNLKPRRIIGDQLEVTTIKILAWHICTVPTERINTPILIDSATYGTSESPKNISARSPTHAPI